MRCAETVEKPLWGFSTKGCRKPYSIFCHVHAAAENDFNFFAAAAANSARLF